MPGQEGAADGHDRRAGVHEEPPRRGVGDAAEHARRAEQHRREALADRHEADLHRDPADGELEP